MWLIAAVYALVRLARELRILKRWRERRPLSCNTCMALWAAGVAVGFELLRPEVVRALGAGGVCLVVLELFETWKPPPAPPMDLRM